MTIFFFYNLSQSGLVQSVSFNGQFHEEAAHRILGSEILTAVVMNISRFWVVAQCSP
jgi:hypothetical protein